MPLYDCVTEETTYRMTCSNCGESSDSFDTPREAAQWAERHDWAEVNDNAYCSDCIPVEEEEEPEPEPAPPPRRRGSINYRDCITVKD